MKVNLQQTCVRLHNDIVTKILSPFSELIASLLQFDQILKAIALNGIENVCTHRKAIVQ